ncbi:hypothetical protein WJX75_002670 [Coccomyxa subellipsoidea]|uniref:Uncharacterized protein n=1 Tax=Coccomyxa subellipsoidea TaxID=248742 RepID=A0ABR2YCZ2_9CHLO
MLYGLLLFCEIPKISSQNPAVPHHYFTRNVSDCSANEGGCQDKCSTLSTALYISMDPNFDDERDTGSSEKLKATTEFKSTYGWSPAKFLCDNWATLVECAKLLSVGNLGHGAVQSGTGQLSAKGAGDCWRPGPQPPTMCIPFAYTISFSPLYRSVRCPHIRAAFIGGNLETHRRLHDHAADALSLRDMSMTPRSYRSRCLQGTQCKRWEKAASCPLHRVLITHTQLFPDSFLQAARQRTSSSSSLQAMARASATGGASQ